MLSLPQMIGDIAALDQSARMRLAGVANATQAVISASVEAAAADLISNTIAAELANDFANLLASHEAMNGDRTGGGSDPDEWDSDLDDMVCQALQNDGYEAVLGSGYIGGISVDTRLHEPGRPEELAREIATQFAKDIIKRDRDAILALVSIEPTAAPVQPAAATLENVMSICLVVAASYIASQGEAFDLIEFTDELDMIADDDDILALGAAGRIASNFANQSEIRSSFKFVRMTLGAGWTDKVIAEAIALNSKPPAPVEEKPKKTRRKKGEVAAAPAPALTTATAVPPAAVPASQVAQTLAAPPQAEPEPGNSSIITGLEQPEITAEAAMKAILLAKEFLPFSEKALAERIGISRSTLNNIAVGKSKLDMTQDMRLAIVNAIGETIGGFNQILALVR